MKFLAWEAKLLLSWLLDHVVGIKSERIVFVTKADAPIAGNLRILLDAVVDSGNREVGVFKEGAIPSSTVSWLHQRGVRVMQKYSISNLAFILSSATVVLSHSGRDAYLTRRKKGRRVVNVWHGVALKKMEAVMPRRGSPISYAYRQRFIRRNSRLYDAVIASGEWDRRNNAAAFAVPVEKVHATGLPRFDYLSPSYAWPDDLQEQRELLRRKLAGRKLILYAPTFRESGTTMSELITPHDIAAWDALCRENGAVLGLRTHPGHLAEATALAKAPHVVDLRADKFPEASVVLLAAELLITDYSSIWVDYLALDRPVIGFVPDRNRYEKEDRGFITNFNEIFPGPLLGDWEAVRTHVERLWREPDYDAAGETKRAASRNILVPGISDGLSSTKRCADLIPLSDPSPKPSAIARTRC